jgi:hypothetical protein
MAEEELVVEVALADDVGNTVLEADVPSLVSEEDGPVGSCTLLGSVEPCEEDPMLDTTGGMPTFGKEVEDGTLLEEETDATVLLL